MSKRRNRRNRRKANARSKALCLSVPQHVVVAPEKREECDFTVAIRLQRARGGKAFRKSRTRNLAISGMRNPRAVVKRREKFENGVLYEGRRDRRDFTPYSRDFHGPVQRKEKERPVTHGECTPINSNEHFFDDASFKHVT